MEDFQIAQKISVDFMDNEVPLVNIVQNDGGIRVLQIELYAGGVEYRPPDGYTANIYMLKPDGTKIYNPADSLTGNVASFTVTAQMAAVAGMIPAQVEVLKGTNCIKNARFNVRCWPAVVPPDAMESTDEYKTVQQLAGQAQESADAAATSAATAAKAGTDAGKSASAAATSAQEAKDAEGAAAKSKTAADTAASAAAESAGNAEKSATAAKASQTAAKSSETAAGTSADRAEAAAKAAEKLAGFDQNDYYSKEEVTALLAAKQDTLAEEMQTVKLTNTKKYPVNNSKMTVALQKERDNTHYTIDILVVSAVMPNGQTSAGDVAGTTGKFVITDKLTNGFKIEYTGAAKEATIEIVVRGGMENG